MTDHPGEPWEKVCLPNWWVAYTYDGLRSQALPYGLNPITTSVLHVKKPMAMISPLSLLYLKIAQKISKGVDRD